MFSIPTAEMWVDGKPSLHRNCSAPPPLRFHFVPFAFQIYFFFSFIRLCPDRGGSRSETPFVVNHFRAPRQGRLLLPPSLPLETKLFSQLSAFKGKRPQLPAELSGTRASAIPRFAANSRAFPTPLPYLIDNIQSRTPLFIPR